MEKVLLEFERRGMEFFDSTLRLGRIFDLVNQSRVKRAFEREVLADLPRVVERRVEEVIDWMVASDLRQWQGVMEQLERRRLQHADRIIGRVAGRVRARPRPPAGERAPRGRAGAWRPTTGTRRPGGWRSRCRPRWPGPRSLQVSALGLGTMVTDAGHHPLADMTGILAAGAVSVLGLLVLPARARGGQGRAPGQGGADARALMDSLTASSTSSWRSSLQRIREAISPYTRFVRSERERLTAVRDELRRIRGGLLVVKAQIPAG